MGKIKKWYNKMLVKKYDGKNIDLLSAMGKKRPFLFCLPLYSPSLYFKYQVEKVAEAFSEGFNEAEELSKEIQKSFETKFDQVFYDDIFVRNLKKKGEINEKIRIISAIPYSYDFNCWNNDCIPTSRKGQERTEIAEIKIEN